MCRARRPSGGTFPCASLDEALPHLRRPPSAAAVQFKIQNALDEAAQVAAYIDARLVFDRLDHVCGQEWSARFEALVPPPVDRNGEVRERPPVYVRCRLTLFRVTREDVGEGQDPKAAFSDAIKRAAVHFGVGRALYAMRPPWLREGDADSELRRNRRGRLVLDRRSEAWCRGMYVRWLAERGCAQFGQPLDHGDESGAAGFATADWMPGIGKPTDQGQRRWREAGPRRGPASLPVPGRGNGSGLPERGTPVPAAASDAGLRPVAGSEGGEPPAGTGGRAELARWRRAGRFDKTPSRRWSTSCSAGGGSTARRSADGRARHGLEFAVRGPVAKRALAGAIIRVSKRADRGGRQGAARIARQKGQRGPPARPAPRSLGLGRQPNCLERFVRVGVGVPMRNLGSAKGRDMSQGRVYRHAACPGSTA